VPPVPIESFFRQALHILCSLEHFSHIQEILLVISPLQRTHTRFAFSIASLLHSGQNIVKTYNYTGIYIKEFDMALYIPFIHKIRKKKEEIPQQIPLYIEPYYPLEKSVEKGTEEKETITIIELF
jgi:hypothetical protein